MPAALLLKQTRCLKTTRVLTMKILTIFLVKSFAGHHEEGELSANVSEGGLCRSQETVTPGVQWVMQKGMPYEGTWIGAAAIEANVFAAIDEMFTSFQVSPIAYYESGDTVFIHVRMTAEGLDIEVMHMAKMEGGKFAKFQVFENTAQMLAAAN